MAAKTNKDYKAAQYKRKKERQEKMGERDMVLPVPLVLATQMEEVCAWHGYADWRELLLTTVRVLHSLGPEKNGLVEIPKCGFVPTAAQLAKIGKPCRTCQGTGLIDDEFDCPRCSK